MNIFFDVDYTILAMDNSLRPGTREVFKKLTDDEHRVFVWSGAGIRRDVVRRHNLEEYVSGVFHKPLEEFDRGLSAFGVTVRPDFVIDDHPEIVIAFGGVVVKPYYFSTYEDDDMETVYSIVTDYALTGRCSEIADAGRSLPRHFHAPWCDTNQTKGRQDG